MTFRDALHVSCYYHTKPSLPPVFHSGWSRAAVPLAGPRWRREAAITKSLAHLRQAPRSSLHGAYLKCFGPDSDFTVSKSGRERAGRGLLCLREAAPEQRASQRARSGGGRGKHRSLGDAAQQCPGTGAP